MFKKGTPIPLIWLLLYIVATRLSLSNYELCIGSDGHVELEVGANGRCTDNHPFDSEEDVMHAEAASETYHCHSCVDLAIFFPLDKQPHVIPAKDMQSLHAVSAVGLTASQPPFPTIPICTPSFHDPAFINSTLVSLRISTSSFELIS
ncbi:MAG: hypothetical protein OXP71_16585 [Candidatus Poribacteria bacterium]|nr:hypothetical protein [Candidatus Poribacteria bacterium]